MTWRHPALRPFLLPCGIDRNVFRPAPARSKTILFMPRKRPVEAVYIRDIFRYTYPEHKDWQWIEVEGKTQDDVARLMGRGGVFLALSRMESLGLTPLEAMASGCIVAGFTGLGGDEYAREENGFWASEDDFKGCVEKLKQAVFLADMLPDDPARQAYAAACEKTLGFYKVSAFEESARKAFTELTKKRG
jgi:glycosyltransferase involved in cell wall biosynthesis